MAKSVRDYIRTIVDFPHEGILFRDVTTLFADPRGFRMAVDQLLAPYAGMRIDKVAGPVGEALIMTAFGLGVAVPAVMGYNWLIRRNRTAMERVRAFGSDVHNVLLAGKRT